MRVVVKFSESRESLPVNFGAVQNVTEYIEVPAVEIVDGTGQSTEAVMSQKATTEALATKLDARKNGNKEYPELYQVSTKGDQGARVLQSIWQDDETKLIGYSAAQRDQYGCIQVGTPRKGVDTVNKKYAEDNFLPKTPNSTGQEEVALIQPNDTVVRRAVSSEAYNWRLVIRDGGAQAKFGPPAHDQHAATKGYVDAVYRHDIVFSEGLDYDGTVGYIACSVYSRSQEAWEYDGYNCTLVGRATASGFINIEGIRYQVVGLEKGTNYVSYFIYYVDETGAVSRFDFYDGTGTFTDTVTQMI